MLGEDYDKHKKAREYQLAIEKKMICKCGIQYFNTRNYTSLQCKECGYKLINKEKREMSKEFERFHDWHKYNNTRNWSERHDYAQSAWNHQQQKIDKLQTELEKERAKYSELIILKNDYKISIMKLLLDDKEERERLSIILNAPNEATKKAIIKRKENEPR